MLINTIDTKYNFKQMNFKAKPNLAKKEVTLYSSSLNTATNDILECLSKQTSKIQSSYEKFLNNWMNEHNKTMQLILPLSAIVTFFSKDKSEKFVIDNGVAILEDKNAYKNIFKDRKCIQKTDNIANSLMQIIDNNIKNKDEKAKLMYSLSNAYLNNFLAKKDISATKMINNLENLLNCVTSMYNIENITDNCHSFIRDNCRNDSKEEFEKGNAKLRYDYNTLYSTWERGDIIYEFAHKAWTRPLPTKFEKKSEPKYLMTRDPQDNDIHSEIFYDFHGNLYKKESYYDYYKSANIDCIEAKIENFGTIKRISSSANRTYCEY